MMKCFTRDRFAELSYTDFTRSQHTKDMEGDKQRDGVELNPVVGFVS